MKTSTKVTKSAVITSLAIANIGNNIRYAHANANSYSYCRTATSTQSLSCQGIRCRPEYTEGCNDTNEYVQSSTQTHCTVPSNDVIEDAGGVAGVTVCYYEDVCCPLGFVEDGERSGGAEDEGDGGMELEMEEIDEENEESSPSSPSSNGWESVLGNWGQDRPNTNSGDDNNHEYASNNNNYNGWNNNNNDEYNEASWEAAWTKESSSNSSSSGGSSKSSSKGRGAGIAFAFVTTIIIGIYIAMSVKRMRSEENKQTGSGSNSSGATAATDKKNDFVDDEENGSMGRHAKKSKLAIEQYPTKKTRNNKRSGSKKSSGSSNGSRDHKTNKNQRTIYDIDEDDDDEGEEEYYSYSDSSSSNPFDDESTIPTIR